YDSPLLKWWILSIAQGGAIACAIIIYGMYSYYKKEFKTLFAGAILFLITFILYLAGPWTLQFIPKLLLFISVITTATGYLILFKKSSAVELNKASYKNCFNLQLFTNKFDCT